MRKLSLIVFPGLIASAFLLLQAAGAGSSREEELWRHRNLGKALYETPSSVAQCVEELKKALDLAPDSFRDRLNYGLALLRAGRSKEGTAELEKAQKQAPERPHTWFNLGIAYKRDGRYSGAIRQFEEMVRLVPDEPVSHYNLGLLYKLTNREAQALEQFEIAARLDPRSIAPKFQIYNAYRLAGKEDEAAKALAAFMEAKQEQKAADESEDMDWSRYAELWDSAPPYTAPVPPMPPRFANRKLAGTADVPTASALVTDIDSDGNPDLIVWSHSGILAYRNGSDLVADSGLADIRGVLSVAAGDFDDDGLADLAITTATGPKLYRNMKGHFEKVAAKLPEGGFEKALWLDFDHDYDLDLLLLGERSVLLRNEGSAGFADYTAHFPLAPSRAIDAVLFRLIPDTKGLDFMVSYADHSAILYRDQLRGVFRAEKIDAVSAMASQLYAVDIDNDGWIDIALSSPAGVAFAINRNGRLAPALSSAPASSALVFADLDNRGFADLIAGDAVYRSAPPGKLMDFSPVALAAADFNGDGKPDLAAVARDGSVHLLTNQSAPKNQWTRVLLNGVKKLKLAPGAEVEVKAGTHYQKKIYEGVPLLFGLGTESRVDTVRISWPNGLIQNETNVAANRTVVYKEAPRLSGSCPMVFAWNGRKFEFIADVLGVAPLGASNGDGGYFPVDHQEYLQIPGDQLALHDGAYEVRITEELHEVTYIDQVRLIAVDHLEGTEILTNEKFKSPPFPEFRLFGVKQRIYPRAARDGGGRNVLPSLLHGDRVYAAGFRHDMAGVAEMHALTLDFGPDASRAKRAVLILKGWIDWADGSTFLAASQGGKGGIVMPYLQVKDDSGEWRTVIEDMGVPSGKPRAIAVDLTGKFLSASLELRIVTNTCVYWDEIYLGEDAAAPAPVRMTSLNAAAADLALRGFSHAVVDPCHEQPEYYDYAQWRPTAMWNPVAGRYTRYGDVRELMDAVDDMFVIMGSGDELRLRFAPASLPPLAAGWTRDFLMLVDGWSKDADANTAFADSVEPLPFHAMSSYPYPVSEHFPDDPAHRTWREKYNIRRPVRFIEPLMARHHR